MAKLRDITGQRFGLLVVVARGPNAKRGEVRWLCQCDCGKQKNIWATALVQGLVKSCGCLKKGCQNGLKHGLVWTREYKIWCGIKDRCLNPKSIGYHNYGGRGITICKEWENDPEQFVADMGKCPDGYSIERINNDLGYFKTNCRWATTLEQHQNTRRNVHITFNQETRTLSNWAEHLGIKKKTLSMRIQSGWSHEKALSTPVRPKKGKLV